MFRNKKYHWYLFKYTANMHWPKSDFSCSWMIDTDITKSSLNEAIRCFFFQLQVTGDGTLLLWGRSDNWLCQHSAIEIFFHFSRLYWFTQVLKRQREMVWLTALMKSLYLTNVMRNIRNKKKLGLFFFGYIQILYWKNVLILLFLLSVVFLQLEAHVNCCFEAHPSPSPPPCLFLACWHCYYCHNLPSYANMTLSSIGC